MTNRVAFLIARSDGGLPGVHPAIHDRIVHGVAHGEPVDHQVDVLDVTIADDGWFKGLNDEVGVLRQPAQGKDEHDCYHHLDNLHHIRSYQLNQSWAILWII